MCEGVQSSLYLPDGEVVIRVDPLQKTVQLLVEKVKLERQ